MKKILSVAFALVLSATLCISAFAADITSNTEFSSALNNGGEYTMTVDVNAFNFGINADTTIDGNGHTLTAGNSDGGASVYSNSSSEVLFMNFTIIGNEKGDVGFWVGGGIFTLEDSTVSGYRIGDGRCAAITAGFGGKVVLNNVKFSDNTVYDVCITGAEVTINEGTELSALWLQDNNVALNIGENWKGNFVITVSDANEATIGNVADTADVSGITVSNEGYYVANEDGKLVITTTAPTVEPADDVTENTETPADTTEPGNAETSEDTAEETTPAETGVVLAAVPMTVAVAALVFSKRR